MVDATNNPPLDFSTLSGLVTAGSGVTSLPTVTINFSKVSGGGYLPGSVTTGSDGSWSQSNFEADDNTTYQITPSCTGYTFTPPSTTLAAGSNYEIEISSLASGAANQSATGTSPAFSLC
jgi:hypothetical protein